MGEVPKIEDIISRYAGEFRINEKICKIRKPSIKERIEIIRSTKDQESSDDFVEILERQADIAFKFVEGAEREDILGLDMEQIDWIISKATGRNIPVEIEPVHKSKKDKQKNQ